MTTTVVVPGEDVQPLMAAVTLYTPAAAVVTFGIEGVGEVAEKPLGPLHAYTILGIVFIDKSNVAFAHTGLLLVATGVAGVVETVTVVVAVEGTPPTVAVTV